MARRVPARVVAWLAAGVLAPAGLVSWSQAHTGAVAGPVYFAEGTTRPGFAEFLTLENAGPTAAPVTVTYYDWGAVKPVAMTLAAHSRTTVDVNAVVGPGADVAIGVDAGGNPDVYAERPMYFNACLKAPALCVNGGDVAAASLPQTSWDFAEGYTGTGFQEYLALFNPNSAPAAVTGAYHFRDGSSAPLSVTVPGLSRATVDVNLAVGAGREVSVDLASSLPIVAERPEYFRACVSSTVCPNGGSDAAGAQPQTTWDFAEGYTARGYQEFLLLHNPGAAATTAQVSYMLSTGQVLSSSVPVAAGARVTVNVNAAVGAGHEVSAVVTSGQPLVAERAMYFQTTSPFWVKGGSATAGFAPSTSWNFAEGYTGAGFQEYLTLQNPGSATANVSVTIMDSLGNQSTSTTTVPPTSRRTLDVNAMLQGAREISAWVTSDQPIVAERPMYYSGCIAHGVCVNIPPPPQAAGDGHLIVVSLLRQHLWAYDHGRLILQTDVTTGRPALPTPAGHYHIFNKQSPFEFISPWPPGSPYYYNPAWVSYAMEFIPGGYYLHDAPWRTWFGPGSNVGDGTHGCVNIPLAPMTTLYHWARIGDQVTVQL